jgi:hypothetical protein
MCLPAISPNFEQGEIWAKAVHYLLNAAERAKAQYAYPHTARFCMRALEAVAQAQGLTEDRNVPFEVGRYLAEHIPGAQLHAFKGRGHVPVSTATGEFCEVLRCFVRTGGVSAIGGSAP